MVQYSVNNETIICVFIKKNTFYSSMEEAFRKIYRSVKNYRYAAIQIEPSNDFKHIEWIVLILRSVSKNFELWLCGDVDKPEKLSYDEYCRSMRSSMGYSRYYNSPNQINHKRSFNNDDSFGNRSYSNVDKSEKSPYVERYKNMNTSMDSFENKDSPNKMNSSFKYDRPKNRSFQGSPWKQS